MSADTDVSAVYDRTVEILVADFGVEIDAVRKDATLTDLDLDSLDLVEFSVACEDEFGVEIAEQEAEDLVSLQQMVDLLVAKGASVGGG